VRRSIVVLLALILAVVGSVAASHADQRGFRVRVLALTTFGGEEAPWLANEDWPITFDVPGGFSPVHCQRFGVCEAQLGTTKSNSGPSTMAILNDKRLKFTQSSVFIVAGIAGIRTSVGTLGDAGIANWVVDVDLGTHFVDPSNAPPTGWLPFSDYDQGALHLNERLAERAYELTNALELADDAAAQAERAHYGEPEASEVPSVMRCDTAGSDEFWVGADWADKADAIVEARILQIAPSYDGFRCSSEFEDPAIASALRRFGFLDQFIVVRTASDFEDERPGTTPRDLYDLLHSAEGFAGYGIAVENAYRVASTVAHYLVSHPSEAAQLTGPAG
jgi:purine nucleoside permease